MKPSLQSELCHVVSISSVKLKSTSTPPFTFPTSSALSDNSPSDAVELPTCPVCLEILDSRVTGLVQTFCGHTHHCNCLLKWGDSRCAPSATLFAVRDLTVDPPQMPRMSLHECTAATEHGHGDRSSRLEVRRLPKPVKPVDLRDLRKRRMVSRGPL